MTTAGEAGERGPRFDRFMIQLVRRLSTATSAS